MSRLLFAHLTALIFLASPATPACVPNLTLHLRNPQPLYVNGGEVQLWRVSFSQSGTDTAYNLTITTQANSFDQRTYIAPSFSATLTAAGTVTPSWATNLAGPWTDGEPADGAGAPLHLRWVVSSLPPGQMGELSYSTLTLVGSEAFLATSASATLSCDPGLLSDAGLAYSTTSTGQRIEPPLMALKIYPGPIPANTGEMPVAVPVGADGGVAVDRNGNVVTAGYEWGSYGLTKWRVRKFNATLSTVLATTDYGSSGITGACASAVAVDFTGNVFVAGHDSAGGRVREYDSSLSTVLGSVPDASSAFGVALDSMGDAYVAGGLTGWGWRVVKYSPSLSSILGFAWPSGQTALAVAVGGDGNVVVAGYEETGLNSVWRVRKWDSTLGTLLSSTRYGSGEGLLSFAFGVAVDGNGNVIVAGIDEPNGSPGGYCSVVLKYDPTLSVLLASTSYDVSGMSLGVAVDGQDNVVVAGSGRGANGSPIWTVRKFDNALNLLDLQKHAGVSSDSSFSWASGLACVGTSTVYVVGYESVRDDGFDSAVAWYELAVFTPPRAPTGLAATGYPGRVGLEWTPVVAGTRPVSGYRVYRQTLPGPAVGCLVAVVVGATASTYADTAVAAGIWYGYRVSAVDTLGAESRFSFGAAAVPVSPLSGSMGAPCGSVLPGQSFVITMTVTNAGTSPASNVTAAAWQWWGGTGTATLTDASPGSIGSLAAGAAAVFTWTATASTAGSIWWSATAAGGGFTSVPAFTCAVTVLTPAALAAWMDVPAAVTTGVPFTATLYVADSGEASATLVSIARAVTVSGVVSAPTAVAPTLPVPVAGTTTTSFMWSYTGLVCGSTILTVTVTGVEGGSGRALAPRVVGRWVTVAGTPASIQIAASPAEVAAGSAVTITVTVYDGCTPANTVPWAPVSLFVVAGGGSLSATSVITSIWGRVVATLTTGMAGGVNGVRADVTAGTWPTGTVYLNGILAPPVPPPPTGPPLLTLPGAATDKNVFSPSHGDIVLARIAPINSSPVMVRIYTAAGRLVRTLRDLGSAGAGQYVAAWDGKTEKGLPVARGVYLIHVLGGGLNEKIKVAVR